MISRKVARYAPYASSIYRELLYSIIQSKKNRVMPFIPNNETDSNEVKFFVRHDIDTKHCMKNMSLLLDIDKSSGVQSGVYLLSDGKNYSLSEHRSVIQSYREAGFEIGLHTVCYIEDNYLKAFERETKEFADNLGFRPRSFTVHGLGEYKLDVRIHFAEEIMGRLDEFGYTFTDCNLNMRAYDYVIEDCHWNESRKSRFIYDDFTRTPPFFKKGNNYLILTHPCYWIK